MRLQREQIRAFIGEPYFSRGEAYFKDGMIQIVSISDTLVQAKAVGTRVYNVQLVLENSYLDGTCSCPAFEDFGPCKHMAATGLAIIAYGQGAYNPSITCINQAAEFEEFEKALRSKTKDELISIIIRLSDYYPEIIDELNESI
ncbi:MAG: SWIM zinc finger family protein [Cytophagales bacterium]|nr:SWIM zinc finger family protein [Cytophagales bacterium]